MVKPVWHVPRHSEADTSETLQSDVMRFIAILALCLIAIFTLVQSLPLRPLPEPESEQPVTEVPPPVFVAEARPARKPVDDTVADEIDRTPIPAREPSEEKPKPAPTPPRRESVPVSAPTTVRPVTPGQEQKRESSANPVEAPPKAATSADQEGLILRFASDNALLALVAQRQVDVYAWIGGDPLRLSLERGVLSFAPASAPKHFHSMMPNTVPSAISRALERSAQTAKADNMTWGVTLPAETQGQLERLIEKHRNGALIIEASGRVRFRQAG